MAHAQFLDELIKEYLLFRGFGSTVKAFDADLKNDKLKSFRPDNIIEQILQLIANYDLASLKELWGHLNTHMFTKLESHFTTGVKKLENAVLKLYLVNCATTNKPDKINEFFVKMTPELQNQTEWKEWFAFPYVKNPEDNSTFKLYFSKSWQDTLLVSLHNFLASVFQYMPLPTLLQYEDDVNKISKLEQRNESLKNKVALLLEKGSENNVTPCHVEPPPNLLDDFYMIAQEGAIVDNQIKSFKNLIRTMGSTGSPVMGRKESIDLRKRKA